MTYATSDSKLDSAMDRNNSNKILDNHTCPTTDTTDSPLAIEHSPVVTVFHYSAKSAAIKESMIYGSTMVLYIVNSQTIRALKKKAERLSLDIY